jgi:amino acid permease
MAGIGKRDEQFDAIVNEVVSEAHLNRSLLLPEEIEYIREHALNKPLGVIHIWALGVGVVITGMYFGWNFGLPVGGPIGVLVASLIVCVLYLAWVLALSELSVAMPFAGGSLAYGRRAVGKWFGFLMGWSMFLECLFATIGTGLAAGGYIAFLINPEHPDRRVTTVCAILCALVFLAIQYSGVKQQAVIMLWLTYAAIAGTRPSPRWSGSGWARLRVCRWGAFSPDRCCPRDGPACSAPCRMRCGGW